MEDAVNTETKIIQAIYDAIREVLKRDDLPNLSPQSRLIEDLNLDSMTVIGLLVEVESRVPGFALDATELEASHLESIGSLALYIKSKV
jgi:acyl carrier protein